MIRFDIKHKEKLILFFYSFIFLAHTVKKGDNTTMDVT